MADLQKELFDTKQTVNRVSHDEFKQLEKFIAKDVGAPYALRAKLATYDDPAKRIELVREWFKGDVAILDDVNLPGMKGNMLIPNTERESDDDPLWTFAFPPSGGWARALDFGQEISQAVGGTAGYVAGERIPGIKAITRPILRDNTASTLGSQGAKAAYRFLVDLWAAGVAPEDVEIPPRYDSVLEEVADMGLDAAFEMGAGTAIDSIPGGAKAFGRWLGKWDHLSGRENRRKAVELRDELASGGRRKLDDMFGEEFHNLSEKINDTDVGLYDYDDLMIELDTDMPWLSEADVNELLRIRQEFDRDITKDDILDKYSEFLEVPKIDVKLPTMGSVSDTVTSMPQLIETLANRMPGAGANFEEAFKEYSTSVENGIREVAENLITDHRGVKRFGDQRRAQLEITNMRGGIPFSDPSEYRSMYEDVALKKAQELRPRTAEEIENDMLQAKRAELELEALQNFPNITPNNLDRYVADGIDEYRASKDIEANLINANKFPSEERIHRNWEFIGNMYGGDVFVPDHIESMFRGLMPEEPGATPTLLSGKERIGEEVIKGVGNLNKRNNFWELGVKDRMYMLMTDKAGNPDMLRGPLEVDDFFGNTVDAYNKFLDSYGGMPNTNKEVIGPIMNKFRDIFDDLGVYYEKKPFVDPPQKHNEDAMAYKRRLAQERVKWMDPNNKASDSDVVAGFNVEDKTVQQMMDTYLAMNELTSKNRTDKLWIGEVNEPIIQDLGVKENYKRDIRSTEFGGIMNALKDDILNAIPESARGPAEAVMLYSKDGPKLPHKPIIKKVLEMDTPTGVYNWMMAESKDGHKRLKELFDALPPDYKNTVKASLFNQMGKINQAGDYDGNFDVTKFVDFYKNKMSDGAKDLLFGTPTARTNTQGLPEDVQERLAISLQRDTMDDLVELLDITKKSKDFTNEIKFGRFFSGVLIFSPLLGAAVTGLASVAGGGDFTTTSATIGGAIGMYAVPTFAKQVSKLMRSDAMIRWGLDASEKLSPVTKKWFPNSQWLGKPDRNKMGQGLDWAANSPEFRKTVRAIFNQGARIAAEEGLTDEYGTWVDGIGKMLGGQAYGAEKFDMDSPEGVAAFLADITKTPQGREEGIMWGTNTNRADIETLEDIYEQSSGLRPRGLGGAF